MRRDRDDRGGGDRATVRSRAKPVDEPVREWSGVGEPVRVAAALLAEALGCTPADLEENRVGRLTRRQRRRLARRIAVDALLWMLGGLAGLGLFVLPAVLALVNLVTGVARGESVGTLFVAAPFAAIVLLALSMAASDSRMVDLLGVLRAQAPVQQMIGEVHENRQMTMGDLTSWITARVDPASLPAGHYAVYHVRIPTRAPILLSAERLPWETTGTEEETPA